MKLYEVTNGYMGDSYIRVYIIAESEERAKEMASLKFKERARSPHYEEDIETYQQYGWDTSRVEEYLYEENYWTNLDVECLSEDCSKEFASEVND